MARLDWKYTIIPRAREIADQLTADTGPPTLRQVFYSLVAEGLIPNKHSPYSILSERTAPLRDAGKFPPFSDPTRTVGKLRHWRDAEDARAWLSEEYALDRTAGQRWGIYLIVEKATQRPMLWQAFGELGFPIAALRGYSSQTHLADLRRRAQAEERPTIAFYAGDFDPSGTDIERDFNKRAGVAFKRVRRVALQWDQVERYNLPPQIGKAEDPRAAAFAERHGRLVQVELEALPPGVLRDLYRKAINRYWKRDLYEKVRERENRDRATLAP